MSVKFANRAMRYDHFLKEEMANSTPELDLSGYAKKDDLKDFVKESDLDGYVKASEIESIVTDIVNNLVGGD